MEENDIDKYFKAEKEGEYLDPPAFVWDSIEQDLKKNKGKKRFFIWWLAGLIFVSGLSTYLYQKGNLTLGLNSELATKTKIEPITQKEIDIDENAKSNDFQDEINLKAENSSQLENNTENDNFDKSDNKSKKSVFPIENKGADGKINTSNFKSANLNKDNEDYNVNSKISLIDKSIINSSSSSSDKYVETKIIKKGADFEKPLNEDIENNFLTRNNLVIPILKGAQPNLFTMSRDLKNPTHSYRKPIMVDKNRDLNTIAVTMHFGKPIFSNVFIDQESTFPEVDWYSYGLGINYHREIINRFYLSTGINIRQSKRKFNYESEEISIQGYELKLSSQPVPLEYGRLISEGEQQFSFFDLSLGLKYAVWSKRIKVSVGLAAILNLQLRSDGKALDNDQNIIRYTNDDNLYQSNLGFGFSPSITVDIPIYKNFNFTVSPNYISYFQNLENEQLLRKMKYSNFGLDFGLNQRF